MSFTVNDIAPSSGYYRVLSSNGVVFGRIYMTAGSKFPPTACPTQCYVPEIE